MQQLHNRRRVMMQPSDILPEGYVRLEYIDSNNAYIITNFQPTKNMLFEYKFKMDEQKGTNLFGSRSSTGGSTHGAGVITFTSAPNDIAVFKFGAYLRQTIDTANAHVVGFDGKRFFVDDTSLESFTLNDNVCDKSMAIGAFNSNGSISLFKQRIYYCKLSDETKKMVLYPCISPSGVVGMFDVINQTFFGSANGNKFIAGPTL